MNDTDILKGKKILIVDDEKDVLDTVIELLPMCAIDTATDFAAAKKLLGDVQYDIVVLDIMGVNGYELLKICKQREIPALMLTAHALTPENFNQSIMEGAKAYIPKDRLSEIDVFLSDVLRAESGIEKPGKWFDRLKTFFDEKFGMGWLSEYHELRKKMEGKYGPFFSD